MFRKAQEFVKIKIFAYASEIGKIIDENTNFVTILFF